QATPALEPEERSFAQHQALVRASIEALASRSNQRDLQHRKQPRFPRTRQIACRSPLPVHLLKVGCSDAFPHVSVTFLLYCTDQKLGSQFLWFRHGTQVKSLSQMPVQC